jgi:hypothetical protein
MPDAVLDPRGARGAEVRSTTASVDAPSPGAPPDAPALGAPVLDAPSLNAIVMRVPKRAQTTDPDRLRRTFVATPPLRTLLHSPGHQVLFGRRGTGKTHALRYVAETVRREGHVAIFLDLRGIWSSGGFAQGAFLDGAVPDAVFPDAAFPEGAFPEGARAPVQRRATHALVDVVEALHGALWDVVLDLDLDDHRVRSLIGVMDRLTETTTRVSFTGDGAEPNGLLGSLAGALEDVMRCLRPRRLWVLVDEWSALPLELQPFLADLLRRTLFAVSGITIKIAAVEHRSRFRLRDDDGGDHEGARTGIDVGGDTVAAVDLDDLLKFGNKCEDAVTFFGELLYRHVRELVKDKGRRLHVSNASELLSAAFATPGAFCELVLAGEGIPRDVLTIAGLAAAAAGNDKISRADVSAAARDYFVRDKRGRVSGDADAALANLVRRCADQRTRVVYLRRPGESDDPLIRQLCDARLIHRLRRGVVEVDDTATAYDVYLLDYGCFVDVMAGGRLRALEPGLVRDLRHVRDRDAGVDSRSFATLPTAWYRRP